MRQVPLALLLILGFEVTAQEVCDNGIDDDGDGLVDLNDTTDCVCSLFEAVGVPSLIPNHSFEDTIACPSFYSQLWCAPGWYGATINSTDFMHTCGFMPNYVPMPLPEGNGIAGFAISREYSEDIGTTLSEPLLPQNTYSLQLKLAAVFLGEISLDTIPIDFGPIELVVFGAPELAPEGPCDGGAFYVELGRVTYDPRSSWSMVLVTLNPSIEVTQLIIGPPCTVFELPDGDGQPDPYGSFTANNGEIFRPYFFIDELILNTTSLVNAIGTTGSICTGNLQLTAISTSDAIGFQWYREGVAVVGQTSSVLNVGALGLSSGYYQVRVIYSDSSCMIFQIATPPLGVGLEPLLSVYPEEGCAPVTSWFSWWPGIEGAFEVIWSFGDGMPPVQEDFPSHVYATAGIYDVSLVLNSVNGCSFDTIFANAVTVPGPVASFSFEPDTVYEDESFVQFSDQSSGEIISWLWDFGPIPPFTSVDANPWVTFPNEVGAHVVTLVVTDSAACTDTTSAVVQVVSRPVVLQVPEPEVLGWRPTSMLVMPNVFTPNGDNVNDRFTPLFGENIKGRLTIYDRWGKQVFSTDRIASGWDGGNAPEGVYYWSVHLLGTGERSGHQGGHVTLVR